MTKLYELTGKYLELASLADDPNMPEDALTDTLEAIEGEIEVKAEALLQVVEGIKSDATAIDNEIKRLSIRKKMMENRAARLRRYLFDNMSATGINKISCPLFSITLSKPRPMVVINNEAEIPDEYIKTTVTKTPIKKDILTVLKKGGDVPGCALGESKRALLIK
jgi:hypothetical protein